MKTISVNKSDIQGPFIKPPENAHMRDGYSYACTEDYILVSKGDEVVAYHWPGGEREFAPWNGTPKFGRRAGVVTILEQ